MSWESQEVGAAISSSLQAGVVLKEQACFLPLSPDGTPVIGPIPGTARTLYVASGELPVSFFSLQKKLKYVPDLISGDDLCSMKQLSLIFILSYFHERKDMIASLSGAISEVFTSSKSLKLHKESMTSVGGDLNLRE